MVDAWEALAKALLAAGQTRDAIAAFGKAIDVDPLKPEPHLALARIYALERQPSLARQHAEIGSRRDEAITLCNLAELVDLLRELLGQRGARTFHRLVEVLAVLRAGLADCLARSGREADAEREFKAELDAIADSPEAHVGLATLYRSQRRDVEARTVLNGLVASTRNPTADTYWSVVRAFTVLGDASDAREWTVRGREKFPRDTRFHGGKRERRLRRERNHTEKQRNRESDFRSSLISVASFLYVIPFPPSAPFAQGRFVSVKALASRPFEPRFSLAVESRALERIITGRAC